MPASVSGFLPYRFPVPVSYLFLTGRPLRTLDIRHAKISAAYQTPKHFVTPFYKHISRCLPPLPI